MLKYKNSLYMLVMYSSIQNTACVFLYNDEECSIKNDGEELCDGVDQDCDGDVDENLQITYYRDMDFDSYGVTTQTIKSCEPPSGYAINIGDCNDHDDSVYPGQNETCDGIDQNCNNDIDEGLPIQDWYIDNDADGYGSSSTDPEKYCDTIEGYAVNSDDCNDNANDINPNMLEIPDNSIDENCDGRDSQVLLDGIALAAGAKHSLALLSDNKVWAWGDNTDGQIANASLYYSPLAVFVENLPLVEKIVAGDNHSMALDFDGNIWLWGRNLEGQLGTNDKVSSFIPKKLNIPNMVDASGGAYHTLSLDADGVVWAWGSNNYGQLGIPNVIESLVPSIVNMSDTVLSISTGYAYSIALQSDGTILGWGNNDYGQLANANKEDFFSPIVVANSFKAISAGGFHVLALDFNGSLWSWGYNRFGQLGNGTSGSDKDSYSPILITSLSNISNVITGSRASFAVDNDGTIWSWGYNKFGQLGDGTFVDKSTPVKTGYIQDPDFITSGENHTLAIKNDSSIWAWGSNSVYQLGNGSQINSSVPMKTLK